MRKKIFIFLFIVSAISFAGFYYFQLDIDKLTPLSSSIQNADYFIPGMSTGVNMPTFSYHGGDFSFTRNDTGWVYFVGGDLTGGGVLTRKNDRYNVKTNTWKSMAQYPIPPGIWYTDGATIGNFGYICAGLTGATLSAVTNVLARYDINANLWTLMTPMPAARAFGGLVGYQDSLLYWAGGFDSTGTSQSTIFLYNAISNSWRMATPLPATRMGGAFARSGDTLIYLQGTTGIFNGTATYTNYVGLISQSNRANITWTLGATFPGLAKYRQKAETWGCAGIIVSGGNGYPDPPYNWECYRYSPGANTWLMQPHLITDRTAHMTGSVKLANNVWKFVNVCGYNGANVFTTDILTDTICGPLGVGNNNEQIPEDYFLLQNYPNPFNPVTIIKFGLPRAENVKLVVYDILGKEVKTLLNEFRASGVQAVSFDGTELPSGVYFYRIETGKFIDVKKMLLVK